MASGRLGANDLSATTLTEVYAVPASTVATVTVTMANRNATAVTYRVAHLNGGIATIANEDYIAYDSTLPANGTVQFTGIVMAATHTICVYASGTGVSTQVWGWEEAA